MRKKLPAVILVLALALMCLSGCSSGIHIEGTWVFEGFYVSAGSGVDLGDELSADLDAINASFLDGSIVQTNTFENGTVTITTSGYGYSTGDSYPYTLEGDRLTYTGVEGVYIVKINGNKMTLTKDSLELRYHRK